jgi:hypothetical protein
MLPSAVPWFLLLGVLSVLSLPRPSSSHPELVEQQFPLFRPSPSDADTDTVAVEHPTLVSKATYGRLERFAMYSSAVYQTLCPFPLGNRLVQIVSCQRGSAVVIIIVII